MSAPGPCKRPRAGGISLATVAASKTLVILNVYPAFENPEGAFRAYFQNFESLDHDRNLTCTWKLCKKEFQKLNGLRSRWQLTNTNDTVVAVCTKTRIVDYCQQVPLSQPKGRWTVTDEHTVICIFSPFWLMYCLPLLYSRCMSQIVRSSNCDSQDVSRDRRTQSNTHNGPFPKMKSAE